MDVQHLACVALLPRSCNTTAHMQCPPNFLIKPYLRVGLLQVIHGNTLAGQTLVERRGQVESQRHAVQQRQAC